MKVIGGITISLDGYVAGPNPTMEEPLGQGGEQEMALPPRQLLAVQRGTVLQHAVGACAQARRPALPLAHREGGADGLAEKGAVGRGTQQPTHLGPERLPQRGGAGRPGGLHHLDQAPQRLRGGVERGSAVASAETSVRARQAQLLGQVGERQPEQTGLLAGKPGRAGDLLQRVAVRLMGHRVAHPGRIPDGRGASVPEGHWGAEHRGSRRAEIKNYARTAGTSENGL
jgi:hypothetical protein